MMTQQQQHIVHHSIERKTRGQSGNPEWQAQRATRITASIFYDVIHTKDIEHYCHRLHDRKMEPSLSTNIWACRIGLESELPAMRAYAAQFASEVGSYYQPGLCVSRRYPQLAATPDFIVYADPRAPSKPPTSSTGAWLVEIKTFMNNPAAATVQELANIRGRNFCCIPLADGRLMMRKEHKFYYQIIGQLNIVFGPDPNAYCDLVLYYKRQITTIRVFNDLALWEQIRQPLINASYVYNACNNDN